MYEGSFGNLMDYEKYRRWRYAYLYYCQKCHRNFEGQKEMKKCKFCKSENIKLLSKSETKQTRVRKLVEKKDEIIGFLSREYRTRRATELIKNKLKKTHKKLKGR